MPAERSRGSRRSGADGNQLVWTMPVEPAPASGIAFATNVTPITFNDPITESHISAKESNLFPSVDDGSPRRPAHSKKKPENHIPRPPNAFILFRSSFIKSQHVSTEVETNHSTLSKIIGLTWQNLPEDERQVWHTKAKAALEDHKRKFPQYAFRPLHSKGKGGTEKRKVREVGPKDLKRCAKIAELLVNGKKGQDLDAAIQEFDKHHVPEIVTRFEAPITEEAFQRPAFVEDEEEGSLSSWRSRSPSKGLSRSPSSSNLCPAEDPGSPPPLVDRPLDDFDLVEQAFPSDGQPRDFSQSQSPGTSFGESYHYSKQSHSLDLNTFSYCEVSNPPPVTTYSGSDGVEPLLHQDTFTDGISCFGEDATLPSISRPSLSINTTFQPVHSLPSLQGWTQSSTISPMSSTDSLSIPVTPCYPDGSQYPPFNAYLSNFSVHHTPSSLSHSSSYEDISSMYSNDCHSQIQSQPSCMSSPAACGYSEESYSNDLSVYQGQHAEFVDFSVPVSPVCHQDDISLSKAKSPFHAFAYDSDFTTFVGSIQTLTY